MLGQNLQIHRTKNLRDPNHNTGYRSYQNYTDLWNKHYPVKIEESWGATKRQSDFDF